MKSLLLASMLFAAGLFAAGPVAAKTLAYPGPDNASFLVDHPGNWEVTPGEEVGDYVTLTGPTGVNVQLRTIPGTESAMQEAIEANAEFLDETFSEVKLNEPENLEHRGLTTLAVSGGGIDGDGNAVGFVMYYIALEDGNIGEIWFSVMGDDKPGFDAAMKVLDSFRVP